MTDKDNTPEFTEEITITVKASLLFSSRRKHGNAIHMGFMDGRVTFKEMPSGEVVGYVDSGNMGGAIDLHDEKSQDTWTINPQDLFEAFLEALEAGIVHIPQEAEDGQTPDIS